MTGGNTVPRYHLYGEAGEAENFDFFHIETISARSAPLGWSLGQHSHLHLFQFLMLTRGSGTLSDSQGEQTLEPGSVVFSPPGVVHGWQFTPETEGYVLSFTQDYLADTGDGRDLDKFLARQKEQNVFLSPSPKLQPRINQYFQEMAEEFDGGLQRRLVFRALTTLLLTRLFDHETVAPEEERAPDFSLFRFRALVDDNFRKERNGDFYAAEMGMSLGRLNRYCRMFTDRTVSQFIRDREMLEAKRLLAFSDLPVSQIAYDLGFDDPAYFSRVFRKEAGVSPQDFRASRA